MVERQCLIGSVTGSSPVHHPIWYTTYMKRKSFASQSSTALSRMPSIGDVYDVDTSWEDEPQIMDPIKLTDEEKASRLVTVLGFKFFDTGYALSCPQCGKISGLSCREDIDKKVDFFLKFGCEHYQLSLPNPGEAGEITSE